MNMLTKQILALSVIFSGSVSLAAQNECNVSEQLRNEKQYIVKSYKIDILREGDIVLSNGEITQELVVKGRTADAREFYFKVGIDQLSGDCSGYNFKE